MSAYVPEKGHQIEATVRGEVVGTSENCYAVRDAHGIILAVPRHATVERLPDPERWKPGDVVRDADGRIAERGCDGVWWLVGDSVQKPDDFLTRPLTRLVPEAQQPVYRVGDPDPAPQMRRDAGDPHAACGAATLGGYCTLPPQHSHPQHVAGTGREVIAVWPVDGAS